MLYVNSRCTASAQPIQHARVQKIVNCISHSINSQLCQHDKRFRKFRPVRLAPQIATTGAQHGTASGPGLIGSLAASARASSGRKARTGDYHQLGLARKHAQVPGLDRRSIRYSGSNRDLSRIARWRHTETFSKKGLAGRFPRAVFPLAKECTPHRDAIGENCAATLVLAFYINAASFQWALPKMKPRPWPAPVLILLRQRDDFAKPPIVSTAPMRLKTKNDGGNRATRCSACAPSMRVSDRSLWRVRSSVGIERPIRQDDKNRHDRRAGDKSLDAGPGPRPGQILRRNDEINLRLSPMKLAFQGREPQKLRFDKTLFGRIQLRQAIDKPAGIELSQNAVVDHFFHFELFDGWIAQLH